MNWHKSKGKSDAERFGLRVPSTATRYKTMPLWQDPVGELPEAPLTALGFTSGIGSMLAGARDQGFKVVGNIEWRDYYRYRNQAGDSTFPANFPGAFMARGLADVFPELFPEHIDLVAGHPECGTFSVLNSVHNSKPGAYSDIGDIRMFVEHIAILRPRFFFMDDLPKSFKAFPMTEYMRLLPDYDLFPEWISNWGYGNIQKNRNRMFMIGALKSEKFTFVPGEAPHDRRMVEAIGNMMGMTWQDVANHPKIDPEAYFHTLNNLRHRGDKLKYTDVPEVYPGPGQCWTYHAADGTIKPRIGSSNAAWDGPSRVLNGGYPHLHPQTLMPLTVRERAKIQGFDDDFVFHHSEEGPWAEYWSPGSKGGMWGIKQTGKAMPVQFCSYFSGQVADHALRRSTPSIGTRLGGSRPEIDEAKRDFCTLTNYSDQVKACANCWLKEKCDLRIDKERLKS